MKKLIATIALALSFSANAFEIIRISPEESGVQAVLIEGDFDRNSYKMISDLVYEMRDQPLVVYARSRGGLANDLVKIMDTIRWHGRITWVSLDVCASACAWSALAARNIRGTYHFHGIYDKTTGRSVGAANFELSARLWQYGIQAKQEWYGRELVEAKF